MTPAQMTDALADATNALAEKLGARPYVTAALTLGERGWAVSAYGTSIRDFLRSGDFAEPEAAFAAFAAMVEGMPCPKARALAQFQAAIVTATAMGIDTNAARYLPVEAA